jgi:hypothetical protein
VKGNLFPFEESGAILPPSGGGSTLLGYAREPPSSRIVRRDWCSELPEEKRKVFEYALGEVNPAHVIYSMSLDEAITLRKSGQFTLACEQANVSADLCDRFAAALEALLDAMERHAQYLCILPTVNPLDPDSFAGETARKAASMNSLLSRVLFQKNNRFSHKLWTLAKMVSNIKIEYHDVTSQVAHGSSVPLCEGWELLSSLQFDLTTSLREATIMLKSFLVSLPGADVEPFRDRLVVSFELASRVTDRRAVVFRRE